jgi:hypothetical protein
VAERLSDPDEESKSARSAENGSSVRKPPPAWITGLLTSRELAVGLITVFLGVFLSILVTNITTSQQLRAARQEQRTANERKDLVDLQTALKTETEAVQEIYRSKERCVSGTSFSDWTDCGVDEDPYREAAAQVDVLRVRAPDAQVQQLAFEVDKLCTDVVRAQSQTEAEDKRQSLSAKYLEVNNRIGAVLRGL